MLQKIELFRISSFFCKATTHERITIGNKKISIRLHGTLQGILYTNILDMHIITIFLFITLYANFYLPIQRMHRHLRQQRQRLGFESSLFCCLLDILWGNRGVNRYVAVSGNTTHSLLAAQRQ